MLRIIDVHHVSGGKLVVDPYVPLRFRLTESVCDDPYLWRTGNLETSLIELIIQRESYRICGVTLPFFAGEMATKIPDGYKGVPVARGVPVVDISVFRPERRDVVSEGKLQRCDNKREFKLFLEDNGLILPLFNENEVPSRCIRIDRVGFFDFNGELCGIGFFDLSEAEIKQINDLVNSTRINIKR